MKEPDGRPCPRRQALALVVLPTPEAITILGKGSEHTNAILHVTC